MEEMVAQFTVLYPDEEVVRVAFGIANLSFVEPLSEERVAIADAVPVIVGYLKRLWVVSKPSARLPAPLATA